MTEPEAAEILRRSRHTVARLRKTEKLAYIPGRPVLIDEADLQAYIEQVEQAAIARHGPEPGTPEHERMRLDAVRKAARLAWFKRQMRKKQTG